MNRTVVRVSCAAPKLIVFDRTGRQISTASGAFYRRGEDIFLLSNWHVFSGCNSETGLTLDPLGALPWTVEIQYRILPDGITALPRSARIDVVVPDSGAPLWHEHKVLGRTVDIAAIGLDRELFKSVYPINADILPAIPLIAVGDPVFILGYPKGFSGGLNYPVWKRGTIASELSQQIAGKPRFLVDATSTSGMSGSPVLFRETTFMVAAPHRNDGHHDYSVGQTAQLFMGIHSGRVGSLAEERDPMSAQLGYVWERAQVEELVGAAP